MAVVKILDAVEVLPDGGMIKAVAWKVPQSKNFPEGVKYGFAYIHRGKRILGYDNERAKGHHKHVVDLHTGAESEVEFAFKDIISLFKIFRKEIVEIRNQLYGGKNESEENKDKNYGNE